MKDYIFTELLAEGIKPDKAAALVTKIKDKMRNAYDQGRVDQAERNTSPGKPQMGLSFIKWYNRRYTW